MNFLLQRKTCFKLASGVCTCRFGMMALHVPPRWRQDQNMYYAIQGPQSVVRVDWMDYWFWWWLFYCSSLDVFKDSSEYNMIRREEGCNAPGFRGGGYKHCQRRIQRIQRRIQRSRIRIRDRRGICKIWTCGNICIPHCTEFLHFANTAVIVFEIEM